MRIGDFTGSHEPLDNITSFVTFLLGVFLGTVLTIAFMESGSKNEEALKIYIAVVTAAVAATLGFAISRFSDRVADTRRRRRRILLACLHVRSLRLAWHNLLSLLEREVEKAGSLDALLEAVVKNPQSFEHLHSQAWKVQIAADFDIDFDEIVESIEDSEFATTVLVHFKAAKKLPMEIPETYEILGSEVQRLLHPIVLAEIARVVLDLDGALAHFEAKQRTI